MWKRIWAIFWVAVEVLNAVATVANLATNKSLFGITNWLPIGAIIFFLATFALLLWGYWLIRDRIRKQTTQEQKNIQLDRVIFGLHPYEWTDRVRRVWRDRSLFC